MSWQLARRERDGGLICTLHSTGAMIDFTAEVVGDRGGFSCLRVLVDMIRMSCVQAHQVRGPVVFFLDRPFAVYL